MEGWAPPLSSCTFVYRMRSGVMMFYCLRAVAFSPCPLFSVRTSMGAGTVCGLYLWRILSFLEDTGNDVYIPSGMSSSGLLASLKRFLRLLQLVLLCVEGKFRVPPGPQIFGWLLAGVKFGNSVLISASHFLHLFRPNGSSAFEQGRWGCRGGGGH